MKISDCYKNKSKEFRHDICSNCPSYTFFQSKYIEICPIEKGELNGTDSGSGKKKAS